MQDHIDASLDFPIDQDKNGIPLADFEPAPMVDRPFSEEFNAFYGKLCQRVKYAKTDSNTFGSALRLFAVTSLHVLGFPSVFSLRHSYSQGLSAVYIFRLHNPYKDGYTHGIYVRVNGFVHRRHFELLLDALVKAFTGEVLKLKTVVPIIKKTVPLYDYLQSLYQLPANLLVNFSHHSDAIAECEKESRTNNKAQNELRAKMQSLTTAALDTIITMPAKYPQSYLMNMLTLTESAFQRHMRATNIAEITLKVGQDAYNIALQDKRLKPDQITQMMEPITRRSMLNRCVSANTTKHIQLLLQQTFPSTAYVHPHPYNSIVRSELVKHKPLDGMIFDPRFLFPLLLTSRWFMRACMLTEDASTNNHAHLLLYGGAGTGKTLILSAIASGVPTYKYVTNGHFQNPELLQSSLISLEEFDTSTLPNNIYKQLLDLKTHVKVDFKNLNPENVSQSVPCMISTNDDVLSVLKTSKKYNSSSIEAALRRLYIVPVKGGPFEKLHGRVPVDSPNYGTLLGFDTRFDKEPNKLQRIFNFIVAFALYQQDVHSLYVDPRMHSYFNRLAKDFSTTLFGTFYLSHKGKIDELIQDIETSMMEEDHDDSSYLVKISTCIGQFQQMQNQFLLDMCANNSEISPAVLRDKTVPQHTKTYYMLNNYRFNVKLMWQVDSHQDFLNREIKAFLQDRKMQLFHIEDNDAGVHGEIQEPDDSDQDYANEFITPPNTPQNSAKGKADIDDLDIESMLSGGLKRTISQRLGVESEMAVRQEQ